MISVPIMRMKTIYVWNAEILQPNWHIAVMKWRVETRIIPQKVRREAELIKRIGIISRVLHFLSAWVVVEVVYLVGAERVNMAVLKFPCNTFSSPRLIYL